MKKAVHLALIACVVALGSWALWHGLAHRATAESEETTAEEAAGEEKPEDFTVTLEKEKWEALGLEKDLPEHAELRPQRMAFGRVLDPGPLATLDGELSAAEAALAASRAENDRSRQLLAAGESTSRKIAETAEAQFRTDEIKWSGLRRRATLEWGSAIGDLEGEPRRALVDGLVRGDIALVRVDLLPGDVVPVTPRRARLLVLGREQEPIATAALEPAPDVDPKAQAQGYLLRVEKPPFVLRPGRSVTAWLELAEPPRAGFALPRSALLRHDGRTWVYVQQEEEKFVRKPVQLEAPLEGEKGWFVDEKAGGVSADDLLIVTGAESLLSEELKAAGGGGPD